MRRRKGRHARPHVLPASLTRTTARVLPVAVLGGAAAASIPVGVAADASAALPTHPDANMHTEAVSHPVVVAVLHRRHRKVVTVRQGDTLSGIASDRCGGAGKWEHLYAANRKVVGSNPNLIQPGQRLRAWCREAIPATLLAAVTPAPRSDPRPAGHPTGPQHQASVSGVVSAAGMGAFEQCVIRAESGGNPEAVNASSGAGGLFQFLPSTWAALGFAGAYPGGAQTAPVSVQEQAFAKAYAESGTSPWAPYDGC